MFPDLDIRGWCKEARISLCKVRVSKINRIVYLYRGKEPITSNCLLEVSVMPAVQSSEFPADSARVECLIYSNPLYRYGISLRKWDPSIIQGLIYAAIAYKAIRPVMVDPQWFRDLAVRISGSSDLVAMNARPPQAVRDMQNAIGGEFSKALDYSFKSAISSIKSCFTKYQNRLSEEEIVTWYREALTQRVLED